MTLTSLSPTSPPAAAAGSAGNAGNALAGQKRHRDMSPLNASPPASSVSSAAASAFRNVSACNRCRLRKNRCDQRLPACSACEKAHVKCVGYDPITKREIPRSYVFYLESRVSYLEGLLQSNGVLFSPPEDFAVTPALRDTAGDVLVNGKLRTDNAVEDARTTTSSTGEIARHAQQQQDRHVDNLVSHASLVAVQGASDSRFLGSASGISFARVVFAAVKSSVSGAPSERGGVKPNSNTAGSSGNLSKTLPGATSTTMRDSFFGLHTKPTIKPAPFPSRDLGLRLVDLYFQHANPQIPILHRQEFMAMFERVYAAGENERTPRESYMLNIVFAIGAGIIVGKPAEMEEQPGPGEDTARPSDPPPHKRRKLREEQRQPEEYHASAIVHLETFLTSSSEQADGIGSSLEELQAVLLLAGFALLRPVAPGLWYIIGVAVRLAIDLGLHVEESTDSDSRSASDDLNDISGSTTIRAESKKIQGADPKDSGRRHYIRDFRRRLWWCVYSFDRLVSTCVGRPFGVSDHDVTTGFPSLLEDQYITTAGLIQPQNEADGPSYKLVAYHYFRLRLLQSEILQVLQYRQAQQARERGVNQDNPYMLTNLPSPFLKVFDGSFKRWRADIDRRLWEWKDAAPTSAETGVQFSPLFLELNYWQAVIMLYRQSLSIPTDLAEDVRSATEDVQSPSMVNLEEREDEDNVFLKVAEAGQKVLKLYRQLHRLYLVNYTFLATHHLFMAGISFLYAIWHSPMVRSHLTLDDVDFTVLAATSVLDDLVEMCPPAGACRDAFGRMSKATIKMCLGTTGFGSQASIHARVGTQDQKQPTSYTPSMSTSDPMELAMDPNNPNLPYALPPDMRKRQPLFDYDLKDLFSEEETAGRQLTRISQYPYAQQSQLYQQQHDSAALNQQPLTDLFPTANTQYPGQFQRNLSLSQSQMPQQQPYQTLSPYSDLDFLDSVSLPDNLAGNSADNANVDPLDFSLGGWDGSLPGMNWDDGSGNVDLFDGFFFGGSVG